MAVRKTLQIGDPKLKAPNKEINDFDSKKLNQVVTDLVDTMVKNGLIGMAAPQIGENFKVFVTQPRKTETRPADQADELRVYVNPKITKFSTEETVIYEGCGSVAKADLFGPVKRPREIIIKARNLKGEKFQFRCDGILARVIQHEYDHLFGIEFTEKISDYRKLTNAKFYIKFVKNTLEQKEASKITIKEYKGL